MGTTLISVSLLICGIKYLHDCTYIWSYHIISYMTCQQPWYWTILAVHTYDVFPSISRLTLNRRDSATLYYPLLFDLRSVDGVLYHTCIPYFTLYIHTQTVYRRDSHNHCSYAQKHKNYCSLRWDLVLHIEMRSFRRWYHLIWYGRLAYKVLLDWATVFVVIELLGTLLSLPFLICVTILHC